VGDDRSGLTPARFNGEWRRLVSRWVAKREEGKGGGREERLVVEQRYEQTS
jgi:hypothetical protein